MFISGYYPRSFPLTSFFPFSSRLRRCEDFLLSAAQKISVFVENTLFSLCLEKLEIPNHVFTHTFWRMGLSKAFI